MSSTIDIKTKWYESNHATVDSIKAKLQSANAVRDKMKKLPWYKAAQNPVKHSERPWYEANMVKHLDTKKKWYEANLRTAVEAVRANRHWYEANLDNAPTQTHWYEFADSQYSDLKKRWQQANLAKFREQHSKWYEANLDQSPTDKHWYEFSDEQTASDKKWYEANLQAARESHQKWYEANLHPDPHADIKRNGTKLISVWYVLNKSNVIGLLITPRSHVKMPNGMKPISVLHNSVIRIGMKPIWWIIWIPRKNGMRPTYAQQ